MQSRSKKFCHVLNTYVDSNARDFMYNELFISQKRTGDRENGIMPNTSIIKFTVYHVIFGFLTKSLYNPVV